MSKFFCLIAILSVLLSTRSEAAEYNYAELQTKSLEEMTAVVTKQQKKARNYVKEDDLDSAIAALKSASRYVLARPDRDENMVAKVIAPLRSQLKELNAFENTFDEIVSEAVNGLKDDKAKVVDRATYYYILLNFMAEFRPDLKQNPKIRPIYEKIKSGKIKLDKKVKKELELRGMKKNVTSPTEIATQILKVEKPVSLKSEEPQDDLETEP